MLIEIDMTEMYTINDDSMGFLYIYEKDLKNKINWSDDTYQIIIKNCICRHTFPIPYIYTNKMVGKQLHTQFQNCVFEMNASFTDISIVDTSSLYSFKNCVCVW